ncbi:MAG: acetylxylan esterase [Spirochaetota bacterium]
MATLINFDRYYANFPTITRESDFDYYWKNALIDMKRISLDPTSVENRRLSSQRFNVYDITYKSFLKTTISARLYKPKKKRNPRPVIVLHDYLHNEPYKGYKLDEEFAWLFVEMRGHQVFRNMSYSDIVGNSQFESPGYLIENILDSENYYLRGVYLDSYRSIDYLRLERDIDCSIVAFLGKGLGGAAAAFCAAMSTRVGALVLDSLAFANLEVSQNISDGFITDEINRIANNVRGKKRVLKRNLSYFDAVNFSDRISVPLLMVTGIKALSSPAECVFSFFNKCTSMEKTIEVYPYDGIEAGGEKQFSKTQDWLRECVYGTK